MRKIKIYIYTYIYSYIYIYIFIYIYKEIFHFRDGCPKVTATKHLLSFYYELLGIELNAREHLFSHSGVGIKIPGHIFLPGCDENHSETFR